MAMLKDIKYDKLMKLKSIYKLTHIDNPKILNTSTFMFPLDSVIHWFRVSPIVDHPSSKLGYFKNNKFLVETVLEYPVEGTLGKFRLESNPSASSIIKAASKQVKEFKWLQPNQTIRIQPRIQFMYHYGALLSKYDYSEQLLRKYNMYYNNAMAMMDRILSTKRETFVILDLPSKLMDKRDLNKLSNRLTNGLLETLPTTAHINLLELWKFMSPEFHNKSVFYNIPPYSKETKSDLIESNRKTWLDKEYWGRINLLLVIDTKCILINLRTLMSFIQEFEIEEKGIKPMRYNQFCNRFLEMLQTVIDNAAYTEDELESIHDREAKGIEEIVPKVQAAIVGRQTSTDKPTIAQDDEDSNIDTGEEYEDHDIETETLTGLELKDTLVVDEEYKSIEEMFKEEYDYDVVSKHLDTMKEKKTITSAKYNSMKKTLEEQKNKEVPYKDMKGTKLKDILDDKKDDYKLKDSDVNITDNKVIFDKSYNKNTTKAIAKEYIQNQYKKDIIRSIYAVQNANIVIENYEINDINSIMGESEEHVITIKPLNGNSSTIKLVLPKVDNNGTIRMSGNNYVLRNQKVQKPIVKTDFNKVMLSSYYGKLNIFKAKTNYNNIGYWLMNTVVKLANNEDIKNLVLLSIKNPDVKLPIDYTHFSRFIKSFSFKNMKFLFEYETRGSLLPKLNEKQIEAIEDGVVIVGARGSNPIVMDFNNRLFVLEGKKAVELDNLYELLNIDKSTSPIEFTTVKLIKKDIPLVVILSYYLGLENLLKLLKVEYSINIKKTRDYDKYNSYYVSFKDVNVLITRDHGKADLILSGLLSIEKTLKELSWVVINSRSKFDVIFTKLQLPLLYVNEIKLLETMFVDPMTLTVLKQMKEPTNFKGLLIRAAEMLVDDNYISSNSIDGMVIKGYERLAGLMYKELSTAIKDHENRTFFSKSKITTNPYAVVNKITEDSTTDLADDLNPIASIKQREDVSSLGAFGRTKEGMSKDTRVMHTSEVGVISEATRDNSDVGITAYLSADPNISNTRGMVKEKKNEDWSNILSSTSLLMPFGLSDDMKRLKNLGLYKRL